MVTYESAYCILRRFHPFAQDKNLGIILDSSSFIPGDESVSKVLVILTSKIYLDSISTVTTLDQTTSLSGLANWGSILVLCHPFSCSREWNILQWFFSILGFPLHLEDCHSFSWLTEPCMICPSAYLSILTPCLPVSSQTNLDSVPWMCHTFFCLKTLERCFSKCGPRVFCIIWEVVRNTNSQVLPLGVGSRGLCFNKLSRWFFFSAKVWKS